MRIMQVERVCVHKGPIWTDLHNFLMRILMYMHLYHNNTTDVTYTIKGYFDVCTIENFTARIT